MTSSPNPPEDKIYSDNEKEEIKLLTELHKQNADYIKTLTSGLTAILAIFGVAAGAVYSAGNQSVLPGSGLSSPLPPPTIAPLFTPYTIFGLMLFQNLLLREILRKAGNQKFLEEKLNSLIRHNYALWEKDVGHLYLRISDYGYIGFGWIVLIISLRNGVEPYINEWLKIVNSSHASIIHSPSLYLIDFPATFVLPHALLLIFLVASTIEVATAKNRSYKDSIRLNKSISDH